MRTLLSEAEADFLLLFSGRHLRCYFSPSRLDAGHAFDFEQDYERKHYCHGWLACNSADCSFPGRYVTRAEHTAIQQSQGGGIAGMSKAMIERLTCHNCSIRHIRSPLTLTKCDVQTIVMRPKQPERVVHAIEDALLAHSATAQRIFAEQQQQQQRSKGARAPTAARVNGEQQQQQQHADGGGRDAFANDDDEEIDNELSPSLRAACRHGWLAQFERSGATSPSTRSKACRLMMTELSAESPRLGAQSSASRVWRAEQPALAIRVVESGVHVRAQRNKTMAPDGGGHDAAQGEACASFSAASGAAAAAAPRPPPQPRQMRTPSEEGVDVESTRISVAEDELLIAAMRDDANADKSLSAIVRAVARGAALGSALHNHKNALRHAIALRDRHCPQHVSKVCVSVVLVVIVVVVDVRCPCV